MRQGVYNVQMHAVSTYSVAHYIYKVSLQSDKSQCPAVLAMASHCEQMYKKGHTRSVHAFGKQLQRQALE
jgi:hypothetical protein